MSRFVCLFLTCLALVFAANVARMHAPQKPLLASAGQINSRLTVAMEDVLSTFAQGERVAKITLIFTLGGAPQATLVTVSGKQYPALQTALALAVSTASQRTNRTQSLTFS